MPRISTLFSIAIHTIVIGAGLFWSVIAPGTLPSPRDVLAFHDMSLVTIADIPPPPVRRPPSSAEHTVSDDAAPLTPPQSITRETGRENLHETSSSARSDVPANVGIDCHCTIPGDVVPPPQPPPVPTPVKPVRLHSGMREPQKIVDVKPIYPALAQTARREGLVILEAVIDAKGVVESVRVLRGVPLLDEAAVTAVQQWRFTPALLNGEPVPVVMTVTVNFQLK